VTNLNCRGIVFDELTNGLDLLALWSVRQKLNSASSVKFSYVALHASLISAENTQLRRWSPVVTWWRVSSVT